MAPLNWGLGHATRCIPIIKALQEYGFVPILAGDGDSLKLLRKEYPSLSYYELPSTSVAYTKHRSLLKYKLLTQAPKLLKAMALEKEKIQKIHQKENLSGIISDNRFGVRSKDVPSIYLTHQLKVLSGKTSFLSTTLHQQLIMKFDQCWVPDYNSNGLAGELSKPQDQIESIKYIGPLSRFKRNPLEKKWDIIAVLSGPEPQRSLLERKLLNILEAFSGKSLIIQGLMGDKQTQQQIGKTTITNFMLHKELRDTIEAGRLILSRSGYSSIMDLEALEARAFFIPTPGQYEQEYLATHFQELGIANYSNQNTFKLDKLTNVNNYKGFKHKKTSNKDLDKSLFDVFK